MLLVTGITGLTGRFLYEEIKKHLSFNCVKFLIRHTSDISWMSGEENLLYGDVTSVEGIVDALKDVEVVIHIAHIHNSDNITRACLSRGIKRVIFVNTTGMFSQYKAYSKLYIDLEEKIKKSDLVYTIIRPTMIYGNHRDVNIHKLVLLMDKLPVFPVIGRGNGLMHPIYAGDLANCIFNAYINEERTRLKEYNVAGKYPLSYLNLLQEIARALGKKPLFLHIPYSLALAFGKIGDYIPNGLIDYEKVQRLVEDKNFDYFSAKNELKFNPISFKEGIELEVKALREAGLLKNN